MINNHQNPNILQTQINDSKDSTGIILIVGMAVMWCPPMPLCLLIAHDLVLELQLQL